MATGQIGVDQPGVSREWDAQATPAAQASLGKLAIAAASALASLKLTVVLFATSVFLILFGTLAQVHYDVWHVVRESHFYVWFAWIEFRALAQLGQMLLGSYWVEWFGDWNTSQRGFYFPGGLLIGYLMFANLLAAHALRFKAVAKGSRLTLGLVVSGLGFAATYAVITGGAGDTIKSELSPTFADVIWYATLTSVVLLALGSVYWLINAYGRVRLPEWTIAAALVASVAATATWLLLNPDQRLDSAGLRILWLMIQGTIAAAVLLAGCVMVFKKRAGIVLLHGGVCLLMVGELVTAYTAQESRMTIAEGQTVNHSYDIRETELAISDPSDPAGTRVSVVPQHLLASTKPGEVISHDELPVDLRILRFDENSILDFSPSEANENLANAGAGTTAIAKPLASVSGVANAGVNLPSVYVELLDKATKESAGVYLASTAGDNRGHSLRGQQVQLGAKTYDLELRFRRIYKDYAVTLIDFQFERYPGSNIAKDFRSEIRLYDAKNNVDREIPIWMNNPLRYRGDTLYQSSFDDKTESTTVLQVVKNASWMTPYVSCMIVAAGLLAHFGVTLGRFLRRRAEEAARKQAALADQRAEAAARGAFALDSPLVWAPLLAGVVWGGYLMSKARMPKAEPGAMRIQEFGNLPVASGGRIKPYDTVARNTLQYLSARQEVVLKEPLAKDASFMQQLSYKMSRGDRVPAIEWLLDVISAKEEALDYPVFRIDNFEVLDQLHLERRPGSYRYSYNEIMTGDNAEELEKQLGLLRNAAPEDRTIFQVKLGELGGKLQTYHNLSNAFAPLPISTNRDTLERELQDAVFRAVRAGSARVPRPVTPEEAGGEWLTLYEARLNELFRHNSNVAQATLSGLLQLYDSMPPFVGQQYRKDTFDLIERLRKAGDTTIQQPLMEAVRAYGSSDTLTFNDHVRTLSERIVAHHELQQSMPADAPPLAKAERVSLHKSQFETFFSQFSPFFYCWISYIVAFVMCALSWLFWPRGMGRAATAIIAVTFVVHTFAIVGRIYISGRPPVTNLYTSAVFIGWAIVLAGLAIEAIYRIGIGSVLASVFGMITLLIAHKLGLDGDTFTVMQAVLDTQFWLATHVVCVTLGYAATFVAGGIGIVYLLRSHLMDNLSSGEEKTLPRMIYGTLCFAILFSFVGTVLGGLWGDNSWGRFWGWDPKENGAVIIVLWNALLLHARWGAMVGPRGLAALAILGNMWTTWSWFGTNELGVGLHAYGGLSDGVSLEAVIVRLVFFSQPLLALLALAPRGCLRSDSQNNKAAPQIV